MPHHGDKRRRIATSSDVHGDPEFWSQKRLAVGRLQQQVIEDHKMMRDVEKYMTNIFKATIVNGWTPKLVRDAKIIKSEPKDKSSEERGRRGASCEKDAKLPSYVPPPPMPKEQLQREVEQNIPDAERTRQTHLQAERARGMASTRGTSVDSATAKADETLTAARKRLRDQLSASR